MARTRTLVQLRSDVCDRCDVIDGGTTGRFTSARLNRYINQAIQRYRAIVVEAGGTDYFVKRTGRLTMNTSTTADTAGWAPNMYVALPSDFLDMVGFDLYIGGYVSTLVQYERDERNMFRETPEWLTGTGIGQPVYYRIGGTDQAGNKVCGVIPFAGAAYVYEILYMPVLADLVNDSDTFDGMAGYEEYIVNQAALYALTKDGAGTTETPLYAAITKDRDEMEKQMKFRFATMAGPGRRLDTQSLRNRNARYARGDWRGF